MPSLVRLLSLACFMMVVSTPAAFAQADVADVLFPSTVDLRVEASESFSLPFDYKSGLGGEYTITLRRFRFSAEGDLLIDERSSDSFIGVEPSVLDLDTGDQMTFTVSGSVPEAYSGGDLFYQVHVKRTPDPGELKTSALASLLFLQVAPFPQVTDALDLSVGDLEYHFLEEEDLKSIRFQAQTNADQYLRVLPILEWNTADGVIVLEGRPQRVFSAFSKEVSFQSFAEDYVVQAGDQDFNVALYSYPEGLLIERVPAELDVGVRVLSQKDQLSAVGNMISISSKITWTDWIRYFVLIVLGLSLIGYGVVSKK